MVQVHDQCLLRITLPLPLSGKLDGSSLRKVWVKNIHEWLQPLRGEHQKDKMKKIMIAAFLKLITSALSLVVFYQNSNLCVKLFRCWVLCHINHHVLEVQLPEQTNSISSELLKIYSIQSVL